jgi:RimJ/RimL family protein N-acetyltransferase
MRTLVGRKSLDSLDFGAHSGRMEVRLHSSVDEFRAIAEPVYRRDPIANTIELTLLRAGRFPGDSLLLTVWNNSDVIGAALHTPPYPLACNAIPAEGVGDVVSSLVTVRPELTGVRGARDSVIVFADSWHAATGRVGNVVVEERLYRLGTLRPPAAVSGAPRDATDDDRALLIDWVEQFFQEAFSHVRDDTAGAEFVDAANDVGHRFVLWDLNGAPVSMAMLRVPAAGVSRIGPVFTPLHQRGHGYGSAVTAAAADLAHRSGTPDVVLFADLANPTSNAIYQRIGFEPVVDSVRIEFVAVD